MNQKRVAAATVAVVAVAFVARYTPGILLERWMQGLVDGAGKPPFGTVGETVLLASNAVNVVEVTVSLAVGVGFGVFLARRVPSVAEALQTVTKTALVLVVVATVGGFLVGGFDPVYALALGAPAFAVCLLVVVGAVAGAGGVEMALLDGGDGEAATAQATTDGTPQTAETHDDDTTTQSSA